MPFRPKSSGWLDAGTENKAIPPQSADQGATIKRRMSNDATLQGSPVIQQVVDALYLLGQITPSGFQDACNSTAQVLLSQLSGSGVAHLSIYTYTSSNPGVCVLAGTAGLGMDVRKKHLVLSGSNWAPCLCGAQPTSPFLYRTVFTAEDVENLPQDWIELHHKAGLKTFLAAHITDYQNKPVGVLSIASTLQAAFMHDSWGLQLSMITTGLVPLLTSPWLSGLSSLAASLVAEPAASSSPGRVTANSPAEQSTNFRAGSLSGPSAAGPSFTLRPESFSEFTAAFLHGAGQLLEATTHRRLGVRLALLSEDQQEVLLLHRSDNSGTGPAVCDDSAYEQATQRAFAMLGTGESDFGSPLQLQSVRIAAAHTLLLDAVASSKTCFVPDVHACLEEDGTSAPPDIFDVDDELVSSIAVVPLFGPSIRRRRSSSCSSSNSSSNRSDAAVTVLGGLYVTCQEAGEFLLHKPVVRELATMLQYLLLQQEFVQLPECWEDVKAFPSGSMSSSSNILSRESNLSASSAAAAAAGGLALNHSANLVVLHKAWQLQDRQQACASEYLKELELHAELDRGGFSTVYDGTWQGSRTAVKVMRVPKDDKLGIPVKSAMEMATLSTLRHPNIVTTYACLTDMVAESQPGRSSGSGSSTNSSDGSGSGQLLGLRFRKARRSDMADDSKDILNIVVMERCDRGSLWKAVTQDGLLHGHQPDGCITVNMRLLYTVLLDVAQSLRYLHSIGMVHCDIKAANVLLQSDAGQPNGFVCKLGDFGLVKLLGDKGTYLRNKDTSGTLTHLAPERLHAAGLITTAVDAFGFGVLMYELYAGQKPYKDRQRNNDLALAVYQGLRPQFPSSTPGPYMLLAHSCWAKGFSDRPGFDVIAQQLQEQLDAISKQSKS